MGKLQRTDTDTAVDDPLAAGAATQDSVQTAYAAQTQQQLAAAHRHPQQQQRHQQHAAAAAAAQRHQQAAAAEAGEDADGSGSEVDGPIHDDKYIKGTRLVVGGWFQACRCGRSRREPAAAAAAAGWRSSAWASRGVVCLLLTSARTACCCLHPAEAATSPRHTARSSASVTCHSARGEPHARA